MPNVLFVLPASMYEVYCELKKDTPFGQSLPA